METSRCRSSSEKFSPATLSAMLRTPKASPFRRSGILMNDFVLYRGLFACLIRISSSRLLTRMGSPLTSTIPAIPSPGRIRSNSTIFLFKPFMALTLSSFRSSSRIMRDPCSASRNPVDFSRIILKRSSDSKAEPADFAISRRTAISFVRS